MKGIWGHFVLSLQLIYKSEIISNFKKILSKTGAGDSAILNSHSFPSPQSPEAGGDCLILVLLLSKSLLLNSQQEELPGGVAAYGVSQKWFVKFCF